MTSYSHSYPRLLMLMSAFAMFSVSGWAQQFYFQESAGPQLIQKGVASNSAFTGGFHKPRFANLDLNLDGDQDLLVYDYEDDRLLTFIGNGNTNAPEYLYSPEYEVYLPPFDGWIMALDFNGDDKVDLFSANEIGGVLVYKNVSTDTELKFELYNGDLKHYDSDLRYFTPLFASPADVPVVDDIDGDGDLDVLSFDPLGSSIAFYKNHSMEAYGHRDSFNFIVTTYCWGRFEEANTTNDIVFAPKCFLFKKKKHAGSNMATIDMDGDGDKDLLLSDVAYRSILQLENGWNPQKKSHPRDTMIAVVKNFPANSKAVDVDLFPTINLVDVNFDGVKDMICAPTEHEFNFVPQNTWYYKNNGRNDKPDFEYVTDRFIQSKTIETGEYSYPALHDVDGDGDFDLFVASPTPYVDSKYDEAYYRIFMYENVGDSSSPAFELRDEDYLNLTSLKQAHFSPSFGDADNDGTVDLLLATDKGKIFFYSNANTPDKPSSFSQASVKFMDIKYPRQISACVADVNEDGMNDLVIGQVGGSLSYYEWDNNSLKLISDDWGGVDVGLPGSGFAIPQITDFDGDGNLDLLVSDNLGYLHFYNNFDYTSSAFVRTKETLYNSLDQRLYNKKYGLFLSVAAVDLNADTLVDLVMGNKRGGVMYLQGIEDAQVDIFNKATGTFELSVFPNPAIDRLNFSWKDATRTCNYRLVNMKGQTVMSGRVANHTALQIGDLPSGNYAAMLYLPNGEVHGKKVLIADR